MGFFFTSKVLGYVKLAVEEGGEIVCGEGKDPPLKLSSPHTEVDSTTLSRFRSPMKMMYRSH